MSRSSVVTIAMVLLGACDLQPGPVKQAAPVATPATAIDAAPASPMPPLPPVTVPPPADAAPAPPPVTGDAAPGSEPSQACVEAGVKFATLIIEHASDPQTRSQYEQDRQRIIASTARGCMRAAWTKPQIDCLIASPTPEAARDCVKPAAATPPAAR